MLPLERLLPLALVGLFHALRVWAADGVDGVDGVDAAAPPGSPRFLPAAEHPVGWRGDGTGRSPAATPPLAWGRTQVGSGDEARNILWATPLPNGGASCPIFVGDRIHLTCEPTDLVRPDQAGGQVPRIRSNPACDALGEDERTADPAFAETIAPLLPQLAKAHADLVAAINARQAGAAAAAYQPIAGMDRMRDLERQIVDQQLAIDTREFERSWAQAEFGFAGQTAVSGARKACAFFATGVSACYDLDGNRTWIGRGGGTVMVEWAADEIPVAEKVSPCDRGYLASPPCGDGLLHQVAQGGGLSVNDASDGDPVYRMVQPLRPRTGYWGRAASAARATLAGTCISLMDHQGTAAVLQPGTACKELQRDLIEESGDGRSQAQDVSTPILAGTRMYGRSPNPLCRIAGNGAAAKRGGPG